MFHRTASFYHIVEDIQLDTVTSSVFLNFNQFLKEETVELCTVFNPWYVTLITNAADFGTLSCVLKNFNFNSVSLLISDGSCLLDIRYPASNFALGASKVSTINCK